MADELSAKTIKDEALRVVATVNKIAVDSQTKDYNPYLAFQTYNETIKAATSPKAQPFGFQARILAQDDAILSLNIGKTNEAQNKATRYHTVYPSEENFNAISAAAQTANKTGADVNKKLEKLVTANPTDIGLAVSLVQTRMSAGNITGSISVLESLFAALEPAKKFQPGLVGLLVKLYEHQGRKQHVRKILSEASEWWRSTPQPVCSLTQSSKLHFLIETHRTSLSSALPVNPSLSPRTPPTSSLPVKSSHPSSPQTPPIVMPSPESWLHMLPPNPPKFPTTQTLSHPSISLLPVLMSMLWNPPELHSLPGKEVQRTRSHRQQRPRRLRRGSRVCRRTMILRRLLIPSAGCQCAIEATTSPRDGKESRRRLHRLKVDRCRSRQLVWREQRLFQYPPPRRVERRREETRGVMCDIFAKFYVESCHLKFELR